MIQTIGSLAPESRAGGKAQSLDLLARHGIPVPPAQVLSASDTPNLKPGTYAVRSSATIEDGSQTSYAGSFESRIRVSAKDVPEAIHQLQSHAEQIVPADDFFVIVQQWIEARASGIAFSQHPTKDMPNTVVIEAVAGSNESVTSGEQAGTRGFAWSTTMLLPDVFPLSSTETRKLADTILQIKKIMGVPVDVEWAWDGHQLWILQARPITRLPATDPLDQEEERVMQLFAQQPSLILDRNDFAESAPRPDKATFQMIQDLYRPNGPYHRAANALRLDFHPECVSDYLHLIFGWLYADASHQPIQTPRGLFAGLKSVFFLSGQLERFARELYRAESHDDPEFVYAKASILAQFAQKQANRPIATDIWPLREQSVLKNQAWKEPKTMRDLYAIIREDTKIAAYTQSDAPIIDLPVILTKQEALDLRATPIEDGALMGQGVSPGIVEGIVGKNIFILSALTPSHFSLLDALETKGIICETGSALSHGAIQCREKGISAIFGVRGATKRLRDGQKIVMDGKRGTVEVK